MMKNALSIATQELPCLTLSDVGQRALVWMQEYQVRHLPIVEDNKWLGMISEEDLLDFDLEEPLSSYTLPLNNTFIFENQHFFDAIHKMVKSGLTCLPVLYKQGEYAGVITKDNLIACFASLSAVEEQGGVVVLKVAENQYDMGQIARIIESNQAKILSVFTQKTISGHYEVSIKMTLNDISRVIATFERFNYEISESYYETPEWDDVQDRYDSFMKFLNL